jgi:hypothetical protein
MADLDIDTTAAGYQNRLADIQAIKTFYGPRIRRYFTVQDEDQQSEWRQRDPILRELLDLARRIHTEKAKGVD